MSDTAPERPLVREYLRALDGACASLPVAQAQELHEMIAAHLDEALPPGASDDEVRAELTRLGTPSSLAATAAGPSRLPVLRRLRNRARRVRWWTWTAIAVLVPALGTGAGFLISMDSAAPLTSDSAGWLYHADQVRAVDVSADAVTQTTVPVRSGQRQGIVIRVWNNSDWTQVILGPGPHWQPFSDEPIQVTVQTGPHLNEAGNALSGGSSYASPGAIPPHSTRWVHLTWTSDACMGGSGEAILDWIPLQVRVGVITRTEDITPVEAFALQGPSQGKCGVTSKVAFPGQGLSSKRRPPGSTGGFRRAARLPRSDGLNSVITSLYGMSARDTARHVRQATSAAEAVTALRDGWQRLREAIEQADDDQFEVTTAG